MGKWLYLWPPPGAECTVLFWRAVWLRRRASDQINVKTIRSRQKQFVSLAAARRQIKENLGKAVKANCRHENWMFSFNGRKIKRRNNSQILSLGMQNASNAHTHVQIAALLGWLGSLVAWIRHSVIEFKLEVKEALLRLIVWPAPESGQAVKAESALLSPGEICEIGVRLN